MLNCQRVSNISIVYLGFSHHLFIYLGFPIIYLGFSQGAELPQGFFFRFPLNRLDGRDQCTLRTRDQASWRVLPGTLEVLWKITIL